MNPGIGPFFKSPCVQIVLVFACIKWKYLPHAYILKHTKRIKKLYTQEHKENKGKPTNEDVMIKLCTRLNGLTLKKQSPVESPTIATYPSAGGRCMTHGCVFQERNTRGVATNVYLRKTSEKPEKAWSTNSKWKVWELYLRTGKVLASHASVTRDGNL